jgi:hypothetical protein
MLTPPSLLLLLLLLLCRLLQSTQLRRQQCVHRSSRPYAPERFRTP